MTQASEIDPCEGALGAQSIAPIKKRPIHLKQDFLTAWESLGGKDAMAILDELIRRYTETQRAYHTLTHIADCLQKLELYLAHYPEFAVHRSLMVVAFLFHDAIYETVDKEKAANNELESARLFLRLSESFSEESKKIIEGLILATKTHIANTELEKVFVDIDLSILGETAARYKKYDQGIRFEYSWVPEEPYFKRRKEVLAHFAQRSPLYKTEFFQRLYEKQAKINLTTQF